MSASETRWRPGILALLEQEREQVDPSPERLRNLRANVAKGLADLAQASATSALGHSSAQRDSSTVGDSSVPHANASASIPKSSPLRQVARKALEVKLGSSVGALVTAATFSLGAISGWAVKRTERPTPREVPPTGSVASAAVISQETRAEPIEDASFAIAPIENSDTRRPRWNAAPRAEPEASNIAPNTGAATESIERTDDTLLIEQALIGRARMALARGDSAQALAALNEHQAQRPDGMLAEERDALLVVVFSRMHDRERTARAAELFFSRHPGSPLRTLVQRSIAANESLPTQGE